MKSKNLLYVCLLLIFFGSQVKAQQPFGGCWHPDYIKDWTPANDPDAKFNRSTVALQPRFKDETVKANPYQFYEGQISACLTMNPMCSQTPSQGANNFIGYNPTYWQYMDLLIWWGGSAGEGIIIPPSAPVTDIAHLNGVKVLGQVFFPPHAFGGQTAWVVQMLTVENGEYIYAKKLYEIAKYYGFDGWFINEETGGGSVAQWEGFVETFNKYKALDGNNHMEIQWYDCGTSIGSKMNLIKKDGVSYFLNYGSPSVSNISSQMSDLQNQGFSKAESFKKAYFGIEVAKGGIGGNGSEFKNLFSKTGHNGSFDLFNPEEGAWKQVVKSLLGTENACGTQAYAAMNNVFRNEGRFWTNVAHDPANTSGWDGASWPGFANAMMERTTIQSKPFISSFSAGLGKKRFVNGEERGVQDWYHRGMQDVMPTWRWWIDCPMNGSVKNIGVSLNWDDAYNQGTSLVVAGKLSAGQDHLVRLYKTKLPIDNGDKFQLVYKSTNAGVVEVKLGVVENANAFTTFVLSPTTTSNGWSIAEVDLSSLNGKTVSIVALNFKSDVEIPSYQIKLGQIGITPAGYVSAAPAVNNVTVQNQLGQDGGDIRIVWDAPVSPDIHHYNVYLEQNGIKRLVGQTRNEAFYIPKFKRTGPDELGVKVSVVSVGNDRKEGIEVIEEIKYPAIGLSTVSLKASKTLVKVNEELIVEARADNFPSGYEWVLPANGQIVSTSANKATVKFTKAGLYDVTVKVTNASGVTEETVVGLIDVSDSKTLNIVSVGKKIDSFSGSLPPEDPHWLIDGVEVPGDVRNKWCIGGQKEHWVVIDLQQSYKLYRFRTFDTGHKESASDNFKLFKIWVSNDKENWTLVVDEKNRPENTKDDYIKPTVGRYVKFMPYDDEKPITIRIWEFQVFGIEGGPSLSKLENSNLNIGSSVVKEVDFSLEGEKKEDNFQIKVGSDNESVVSVSDLSINESTGKISFKLIGNLTGAGKISIALVNGAWTKSSEFQVRVVDPSNFNVLLNIVPEFITTGSDYDEVGTVPVSVTDGKVDTWLTSPYDVSDHELKFDLGEDYTLSNLKFLLRAVSGTSKLPTEIVITCGSVKDNLIEIFRSTTISESMEFDLQKPATGRYLNVKIKSPSSWGWSLREIEAYGKKATLTAVGDLKNESNVNVYPNPVAMGQVLKIEARDAKNIKLLNLTGAVVHEQKMTASEVEFTTVGLNPGIYLVAIEYANSKIVRKVTVK